MNLNGKVAVVTGGGSGLGRTVARKLAGAGARVVLADIAEAQGQEVAQEITAAGGKALFVCADVGDETQVRELMERAVVRFGGLDLLVNNAGVIARKGVLDSTLAEWKSVFRVNVDSVFLTAKYAIPRMQGRGGGAIVNVSSLAAELALPARAAYCASKGAVSSLTRQLAVEFGPARIRVNAVAPGTMEDTGIFQSRVAVIGNAETVRTSIFGRHPLFQGLGQICQTDDVADVILFLCSEQARMITGVIVPVDGGRSAFDN
ncbi:MAG TPA: hypothetical protein DEP84_30445 [Chloroflexi bacterium]|nr:hypothetical protein [Chloroflexota bacterium]